jgi:hypothetical protein
MNRPPVLPSSHAWAILLCKLARVLVRDIRTIRRWKTGESPVPKVVEEWLREKTKASERSK